MKTLFSSHVIAILQALLVTLLWSLSFVFIKFGLRDDLPPLTFAGLRYTLAFLMLLMWTLARPRLRRTFSTLTRRQWGWLVLLGVVYYAAAQGAQFISLKYVTSVMFSLVLNFSPVVVMLAAIPLLREHPTRLQWIGTFFMLVGVVIYFFPINLPLAQILGILAALVALLSNAGATVLGRYVNRGGALSPLVVTVVSMGIGSVTLLGVGVVTEPTPILTLSNWLLVVVLATVNTALAFTLWNMALRTLTAAEASVINNTMLIQLAILGWLFLGEALTGRQIFAVVIVAVSILVVQLRELPPRKQGFKSTTRRQQPGQA